MISVERETQIAQKINKSADPFYALPLKRSVWIIKLNDGRELGKKRSRLKSWMMLQVTRKNKNVGLSHDNIHIGEIVLDR